MDPFQGPPESADPTEEFKDYYSSIVNAKRGWQNRTLSFTKGKMKLFQRCSSPNVTEPNAGADPSAAFTSVGTGSLPMQRGPQITVAKWHQPQSHEYLTAYCRRKARRSVKSMNGLPEF